MKSVCVFLSLFFAPSVWGHALCVSKPFATLRKGPGYQFEKSWTVSKYMPFLKVEQKGGWWKVKDMDGDEHWGRSSDFSSQLRCVVVKTPNAETKQGPGKQHASSSEFRLLDRYTPLKRLESEDAWIQVENDLGHKSWIHESQIWRPVKIQAISF